ncbi:hypothetical protein CMUS01_16656 [Colletotrichum musicola]|uniref:Uncharacterized protein n=1 Tax=Colletotrichum musicola TaxID=2175873 RepID=A0A8H6ILC5_9PEZI|nr:hypothetical protein CMUS01_16656 [Colletotrichum musicola]
MEYLNWSYERYLNTFPAHNHFAFSVILVAHAGSDTPEVLLTLAGNNTISQPLAFLYHADDTPLNLIIARVANVVDVQITESHILTAFEPLRGGYMPYGPQVLHVDVVAIPEIAMSRVPNDEAFRSRHLWATRGRFELWYWARFRQSWAERSVRQTFDWVSQHQDLIRSILGVTLRPPLPSPVR